MHQVLLIAGTRPEAIKLAPVLLALRRSQSLRPLLCSTGQHKEMLRQAWQAFGLQPDIDMHTMTNAQTLAGLSARLFAAIDAELEANRPDFLLVQGDTTTVMVAATCAFYRNIPVGHVEAGLRSHDLAKPFPEEFNRRVVSLTTALHFAPTEGAAQNLYAEGVVKEQVIVTGNTVVDALRLMRERVRETPPALPIGLAGVVQEGRPLVLITVHRRELSTKGLNSICEAVEGMARDFPQIAFVWPVHLNPCIKDTVTAKLGSIPNILLTAPLEYPVFVFLLDRCHFVLSDSGGIQEEAPSFGKQVLVLREVTERPEAVDAGFCRLLGSDALAIRAAADRLLRAERPIRINAPNPFGDGHSAERIVQKIEMLLGCNSVQ